MEVPMESVINYFANIGMNLPVFLKLAGILLLGALLISGLSRFIFRKQTLFGHAVSSSIAILFIYVVMVLFFILSADLRFLITPLPFATLSENAIHFFRFTGAGYSVIAAQLLSMIILAFLVNLLDTLIPAGKKVISWIFYRILTVGAGFLLHYLVTWLFTKYLPQGIILYAPAILLAVLVLMLLTGALRFLVGLLLTTVNPLIAALYTFFFASLIGKQITKAVLTTGILSGVILLLEKLGIQALSLHPGAMVAYIPFLLLLVPVWYLISKK